MNLISLCLEHRSQEEPFVYSREKWWSWNDLRPAVHALREKLIEQNIERVAIENVDRFTTMIAFLAFDGVVEKFLILPSLDSVSRSLVLRRAQIATVLTGNDLGQLLSDCRSYRETEQSKTICYFRRTKWLLTTSGTTSAPKVVEHDLLSLSEKVSKSANSFTWGLVYELNRFAGLQVLLQALCVDGKIVLAESDSSLDFVLQYFVNAKVDALSATPSLWRKILMLPGAAGLNLCQVTLGGEIVDQPTLDFLRDRFPAARVTHIYASTEVGVGFAVHDGCAGFPHSFLKQQSRGIQLAVSADGELLIQKSNHSVRYLEDEAGIVDQDGYIRTGDLVERNGDRWLFLGRRNGSVNIGGNKVMPEEVESVIRELNFVAEVKVGGFRSPILGALLEAEVVFHPNSQDPEALKAKLVAHCKKRLLIYKVPARVRIVESIVVTSAGKLRRAKNVQ